MSIVKNSEQENKNFNKCKIIHQPHLVLRVRKKTADIHYDMWPINYDLSSEASKKILGLFFEINEKNQKTRNFWAGTVVGSIYKVEIQLANEYFQKISEIIFDKNNWRKIGED